MSHWICGVDEAGRGPLVGSVVAAAVILDPNKPIEGLKDSKKLSEKQRNFLYDQIVKNAFTYHIACASHQEIDAINILQATMLAMRRAIEGVVEKLGAIPHLTLIDGNRCPQLDIPMEAIVKGDTKIPEISAASILAKTARDAELYVLDKQHPEYGFAKHKGYPTPLHMEMLQKYGVLDIHRKTYAPVKKLLNL